LLLLRATFLFTATLSFLHETGALRRYAIKFAEDELGKNMNGVKITLSDGQFDLWRGKVIARDLIIHNKDRDNWEWDSPCLARVGRVEIALNFTSVIKLPLFGRILNHTFFDVYTILVEDVQVFVEKRKNVFNFHLLDPSLNIPGHTLIMDEYNNTKKKWPELETIDGEILVGVSKSVSLEKEEAQANSVGSREEVVEGTQARETEEEANKIVEKLVGAVSKIGKAANEGGSKALQSVLRNQKDGLVQNLKQLRTQKSMTGASSDKKDWESKKKHGVSVMRELGKVVEKNVIDIKTSLSLLQKPPEKKQGWQSKSPDYIRVGSLLLREGRIFTKDILLAKGGKGDSAVSAASVKTTSGWARPIFIFELAITGAELCPPMSARDPSDGMPLVGISMERLLDIVQKRIMAEVAKSETGRLFQTAFGEVFSFVGENSTRKDS
jgi:hypothetical protein